MIIYTHQPWIKKNNNYSTWHVYVLYLEDEKWYVGIALDVNKRYIEHETGSGAHWTRKHKPLKLVYDFNTGLHSKKKAEDIESQTTIALMRQYGRKNVRGGRFVNSIQAEINRQLGEKLCKEIDIVSSMRREHVFDEFISGMSSARKKPIKASILTSEDIKLFKTIKRKTYYEFSRNRKYIDIFFEKKPSAKTIKIMHENGWNYYEPNRSWGHKVDADAILFAISVCGTEESLYSNEEFSNETSRDTAFLDAPVDEGEFIEECDLYQDQIEDVDFNENEVYENELPAEEWIPLFDESSFKRAEYIINNDKHRVEIYFYRDPGREIKSKLKVEKWNYYGVKHFWHRKFAKRTLGKRIQFAKTICDEFNDEISSEQNLWDYEFLVEDDYEDELSTEEWGPLFDDSGI